MVGDICWKWRLNVSQNSGEIIWFWLQSRLLHNSKIILKNLKICFFKMQNVYYKKTEIRKKTIGSKCKARDEKSIVW
jgi:hypothetical protein